MRLGIGEITSWKSCPKPPIAEIFAHVTIPFLKMFLIIGFALFRSLSDEQESQLVAVQ